jgi:hypothetical protein
MLPRFNLTKEHKFWQPGETELTAKQAAKNADTDDIPADLTLSLSRNVKGQSSDKTPAPVCTMSITAGFQCKYLNLNSAYKLPQNFLKYCQILP